ncbi:MULTISPECIES: pirin family protein [unclassified Achromobacter]|uniref:pirin family protein n=1 Tax=unclassified Achromobacter TaxID=2626865 RepID=UPI00069DDCCB|nr:MULTISPECIES: pirin family protein [unclassified Achromobacter]KOF53269.1 pirin [Achromobacter sp. DMS1]
MSTLSAAGEGRIETVVVPRTSDLGGFEVRRALPSAQRRAVGPFVFLDQMGPAEFAPGAGLDVRPHPHIGLSTVTYLYEGAIVHRDGAGHVQTILPGEVNWMTAGRGIVHSERSSPESRLAAQRLCGLQLWVGLPREHEEADPGFTHYGLDAQPVVEGEGVRAQVVAGSLFGRTSQVRTLSPLFYGDLRLQAGAAVVLPAEYEERAAYLTEGAVEVDGQVFESGRLVVFAPGRPVEIRARSAARFAVLGGEPLDGPRFVWWNFVSSSKERIEEAKRAWQRDRFGQTVPGDETEFIPLPAPRA